MVVAYRLGPFTHKVAQALLRTPYVTLFNVAAGAFVAPERIQGRCTGTILAADLSALLDDPGRRRDQVAAQLAALERLRGGIDDPIGAAADAVVAAIPA
jgi:lipid-A-disaccharide synthase